MALRECHNSCVVGAIPGRERSFDSRSGRNGSSTLFENRSQSAGPDVACDRGCCNSSPAEVLNSNRETSIKKLDDCVYLSINNSDTKPNSDTINPIRDVNCCTQGLCGGESTTERHNSSFPDKHCGIEQNEDERQNTSLNKHSKDLRNSAIQKKLHRRNTDVSTEQHSISDAKAVCVNTCCKLSEESVGSGHALTCGKVDSKGESTHQSISKTCRTHLESPNKKHASYLEIGRCVCRRVLSLQEICCSRKRRGSALQIEANGRYLSMSSDQCCGQGGANPAKMMTEISEKGRLVRNSTHHLAKREENDLALSDNFNDIEKGECGTCDHVSISISGMTCTSCAKKAVTVLNRIPGVSRPEINFITSSGEFNVDSRQNVLQVIRQIERETGFQCTQVIRGDQTLDIIMSKAEAQRFQAETPKGVHSLTKTDGKRYTISFNPRVVGARSVLDLVPSRKLASPRNEIEVPSDRKKLFQMAWSTALSAVATIPVVVLAWSHTKVPYSTQSIVSLVLATFVQAIAISEFYVGAMKAAIFSRVVEMDMLVVIGVTAAYGYSVTAFALTHAGYLMEQKEIFETSTLLITLVLTGRLVSVMARVRAVAAVSVKSLQVRSTLLVNSAGQTFKLDARLLHYEDEILVPSHTQIVTDGRIMSGSSTIDESMTTGESSPVVKYPGDSVIAGTMNGMSPLKIRVTRLPGANSITDIANLVQNALSSKPRIQELADLAAGWLTPVVVATSIIVFVIWLIIALQIRRKDGGSSVGLALTYSIAVLAVSCPCALGLAVPMVLVIAGGVAAKCGVVIKNASATERAYRTTDVVFDKTGTLTTSKLEVIEEFYSSPVQPTEAKALIRSILRDNGHLVSIAVSKRLQSEGDTFTLENIQSIPGAGIQAMWNGKVVKGGNPHWLGIATHADIKRFLDGGMTILGITVESNLIAAYGLRSTLRPEAKAIIRELTQRSIVCHIVSGDGMKAVMDAAQALDVNKDNTVSRQTPSDKREYVQTLIDRGKSVLFCGDGTNDAVAIAQAHVGIVVSSAADVTRATADVVLTGGLDGILVLLDISKQSFLRICLSFIWCGIYNLFAILLAAGAFVKARIPPAYAGLGEIVSVLPIILLALSLLSFKRTATDR